MVSGLAILGVAFAILVGIWVIVLAGSKFFGSPP